MNEVQVMCYIDGKPLFTSKGFEGILLLIAAYWVFQIAFPSNAKQQFAFISLAILKDVGAKDIAKDILNKITLTNALKRCGITTASAEE